MRALLLAYSFKQPVGDLVSGGWLIDSLHVICFGGLALYEAFNHQIRPLFFFAVVPGAVSVALVFRVRERPQSSSEQRERGGRHAASALRTESRKLLPRRYWQVLVVLGVFNLANFCDALLILRANEVGLSFVSVILVYALFNLTYATLSFPAGIVCRVGSSMRSG